MFEIQWPKNPSIQMTKNFRHRKSLLLGKSLPVVKGSTQTKEDQWELDSCSLALLDFSESTGFVFGSLLGHVDCWMIISKLNHSFCSSRQGDRNLHILKRTHFYWILWMGRVFYCEKDFQDKTIAIVWLMISSQCNFLVNIANSTSPIK